jgi:hypothetical protein
MINQKILADVLYNLDYCNNNDPEYCKGILVGVVSVLMAALNINFYEAISIVKKSLPNNIDPNGIPEIWIEAFEDITKK